MPKLRRLTVIFACHSAQVTLPSLDGVAMWKDAEAVRRARVRQLYEDRPEEHTETEILPFFVWLDKYHPDLLPRGPGDLFEKLKADLKGLYRKK